MPFIQQYPAYDAQIMWTVLNKDSVLWFPYFSAAVQPVIMLKSSYCQGKQRERSRSAHEHHEVVMSL